MANQMFRFSNSRYLNPSKILSASVYKKDDTHRVAIKLDAKDPAESTVYTDPFADEVAAHAFAASLPVVE